MHVAEDVNKLCFMRSESSTQNYQHHLTLYQGKHSNLPKELLTEKDLAGRPKATYLDVHINDIKNCVKAT